MEGVLGGLGFQVPLQSLEIMPIIKVLAKIHKFLAPEPDSPSPTPQSVVAPAPCARDQVAKVATKVNDRQMVKVATACCDSALLC